MMKYKIVVFFFLCQFGLAAFCQGTLDGKEFSLEGFVTSRKGINLVNVNIVNINQNTGTTSNTEGLFKIQAKLGDLIRFSSIGFIPFVYVLNPGSTFTIVPLHITLADDTLQLSEVTIYPWPKNISDLKRAVLAMAPEQDKYPDLRLNEFNLPRNGKNMSYQKSNTPGLMDPGVTYAIKGPITALYNAFSKEAKSKRKYELLTFQDQKKKIATYKYNPELIRRVTSFKTDKDIEDFMHYCNFTVDFILASSEYDLIKAIEDCLLSYNAPKKNESPN